MGSVNRVILLGNLGKDAELRYTSGGTAVSTLSLATSEKWTGKDGKPADRTEWHRCVLWGKQAESLNPYLTKGQQVYLEGRIQTRKWTDKDDHQRYTTEIRTDRVVLIGKRESREDPNTSVYPIETKPLTEEDIPFAWLLPLAVTLGAMV